MPTDPIHPLTRAPSGDIDLDGGGARSVTVTFPNTCNAWEAEERLLSLIDPEHHAQVIAERDEARRAVNAFINRHGALIVGRDEARARLAKVEPAVETLREVLGSFDRSGGGYRYSVPAPGILDRWRAVLVDAEEGDGEGREVTHMCPEGRFTTMPCCGRTPLEAPSSDRMTLDRDAVNCPGRDAETPEGETTAPADGECDCADGCEQCSVAAWLAAKLPEPEPAPPPSPEGLTPTGRYDEGQPTYYGTAEAMPLGWEARDVDGGDWEGKWNFHPVDIVECRPPVPVPEPQGSGEREPMTADDLDPLLTDSLTDLADSFGARGVRGACDLLWPDLLTEDDDQ